MSFIPKKNGKASKLSLLFMTAGIALFAFSSLFFHSLLFQLAAVVLSTAGIQFLVRFVLSDFKYVIDDLNDGNSDFIVYKTQGRNKIKVCHISLSSAEEILTGKSTASAADRRYNYVQNIFCDQSSIFFFDGDKRIEIIIEADSAFLDALKIRLGKGEGNTSFAM